MHDRRAMENKPHFVYQLWAGKRCLYVGLSSQPVGRITFHSRKFWWPDVDRVEAKRYPDRRTAVLAEGEAIEKHQPAYNWLHTDLAAGSRTGAGHAGFVRRKADHIPEGA